jgi:hypothetical protein
MQYMDLVEFHGYLVISTDRILVLRFTGDEDRSVYMYHIFFYSKLC